MKNIKSYINDSIFEKLKLNKKVLSKNIKVPEYETVKINGKKFISAHTYYLLDSPIYIESENWHKTTTKDKTFFWTPEDSWIFLFDNNHKPIDWFAISLSEMENTPGTIKNADEFDESIFLKFDEIASEYPTLCEFDEFETNLI